MIAIHAARVVEASARSSGPSHTRSELEMLFLVWVCGYELDVFWPEHRLAVELDSWEHHAHRAAFESDRERIRVLEAAGIRCIPVTYRHIHDAPIALERDLRKFLKCPP